MSLGSSSHACVASGWVLLSAVAAAAVFDLEAPSEPSPKRWRWRLLSFALLLGLQVSFRMLLA